MNPQDIFTATVMLAAAAGVIAGVGLLIVYLAAIVNDRIERLK